MSCPPNIEVVDVWRLDMAGAPLGTRYVTEINGQRLPAPLVVPQGEDIVLACRRIAGVEVLDIRAEWFER